MELDRDLQSIQQVRDLMAAAKAAQKILAEFDQQKIDKVLEIVCEACEQNSERLAKMAVEETGFGKWRDKLLKNKLGSRMTLDFIRDMKTIGVIREDAERKLWDVAVPVGVVAALIPSTNPTSTTMYKSLISLKAGNAVVFSPHPNAKGCILETVRVIREALRRAGAPEDAVSAVSIPTIEATNALIRHPDTGIILATGGPAMVKAAYSSGNPALGVGAGNAPAFIERTADIPAAIRRIFASKCFDNGTICASEQSIVTERCICGRVVEEIGRQGGYFLNERESELVGNLLMRPNGSMNPAIVGRDARTIAKMAGITVQDTVRVLLSEHTKVGERHPYSREKLCPVLGFFVEEDWKSACERSIEILNSEGAGHTLAIHSEDEAVIREFALKKPVMRIIVNAGSALGGVGATTGLAPALTLGCGAVGGSSTSDNVTPMHLFNVRRVAWGLREIEELYGGDRQTADTPESIPEPDHAQIERAQIERIAAEVIQRLMTQNKL